MFDFLCEFFGKLFCCEVKWSGCVRIGVMGVDTEDLDFELFDLIWS